jgi:hypothetical protein
MSEEVLRLVRTVERLPRDDQYRILKIVELLTLAPRSIQRRTQSMLRKLVDSEPNSKSEALAIVDEVIEYLEDHVAKGAQELGLFGRFHMLELSGREPDA